MGGGGRVGGGAGRGALDQFMMGSKYYVTL